MAYLDPNSKKWWQGGRSGSRGNIPLNINPAYTPHSAYDFSQDDRLVLFYGFNGLLAQKYSVIVDMSPAEITSLMETSNKVPYKIETYNDFMAIVSMFENTPNALTEIAFEDAMNTLRIGEVPVKVDDYEEPEEEEFTDNCVESCKPGAHACGK